RRESALASEAVAQPAHPPPIAALPPQEIAEPEPEVAVTEPPPTSAVEILPPDQTEPLSPPPHKPVVRQPAKTVVRPQQQRATASAPTPAPSRLAEAPQAATAAPPYRGSQSASPSGMPAPVPGPELTANYSAMISAWFESHKHYPEAARQRGEEGGVKLRFRVDRFGRVLDYR